MTKERNIKFIKDNTYLVDGVECERFMLVFGDEGVRIVDNRYDKELYAADVVSYLNEASDEICKLNRWLEYKNKYILRLEQEIGDDERLAHLVRP